MDAKIHQLANTAASVPPVSVVIVNYNAGAILTECVRSVLQSTMPVEVIVADNGSDDGSISRLRKALHGNPTVRIIENHGNLGFARANNLALPYCHGRYILFLNPDCVIEPDTLARVVTEMEKRHDVGLAGCLIVNSDGSEQAGCRRYVPTPWRSLVRVLHLHQFIKNHPRFQSFVMTGLPLPSQPEPVEALSGAFMLGRRDAMDRVGPLDDNYFLHCEDIDWCMRFRAAGWKVLFVPSTRIVHWKGFSSRARPIRVEFHKHRGMVRFYRKFFRHQYPGLLMLTVVTAVWARFFAKVAWILLTKVFRSKRTTDQFTQSLIEPEEKPPRPSAQHKQAASKN